MSDGDAGQRTLFDPEGAVSDLRLTIHESPLIARPARVGFLAGMLAVWTLPEGKKPSQAEEAIFLDIARRTLTEAGLHRRP